MRTVKGCSRKIPAWLACISSGAWRWTHPKKCLPQSARTAARTSSAFPAENQYVWELTRQGKWEEARTIYRWFTPLLHLDVSTKFVQYIKLAVQECGLGKQWVRAPRLVLKGEERKRVLKIIHDGIADRPKLPKRGKA